MNIVWRCQMVRLVGPIQCVRRTTAAVTWGDYRGEAVHDNSYWKSLEYHLGIGQGYLRILLKYKMRTIGGKMEKNCKDTKKIIIKILL